MHKGRFPAGYVPGSAQSAPRSPFGPRLLDDMADAPDVSTRRAWLAGVGAFLCASAVATITMFRNRALAAPASTVSPPQRKTLAWALTMANASDEELVLASGDLEMVSAQHRREQRLVPLFERLLDIALGQELEHADVAGACAVRSLARLGRPELALRRQETVQGLQRPETQMALDGVRQQPDLGQHPKPPERRQ